MLYIVTIHITNCQLRGPEFEDVDEKLQESFDELLAEVLLWCSTTHEIWDDPHTAYFTSKKIGGLPTTCHHLMDYYSKWLAPAGTLAISLLIFSAWSLPPTRPGHPGVLFIVSSTCAVWQSPRESTCCVMASVVRRSESTQNSAISSMQWPWTRTARGADLSAVELLVLR